MEITWYGHSCFRMMERGVASIVTDPYDEGLGYDMPNLKADIVTVSHNAPGHDAAQNVKGAEHVLDRPGEYEIGGIFMTAVATYDKNKPVEELQRNNVFVYNFGAVKVCHLGDLDHVPDQEEIESFGPIDVLLIPVGGGGALTSGQASEVISLIEPSVVIPMHYGTDALTLGLDSLDRFLKEMGVGDDYELRSSFKINKSGLGEGTEIVVLGYQQ